MDTDQQFGGEHTEIKLRILEKYAQAYLNALKSKNFFSLCYIDAFAGSGERTDKKDRANHDLTDSLWDYKENVEKNSDVTPGSAKLILDNIEKYPADIYYFIEKDRGYAEKLESIADKARKKLSPRDFDQIQILNDDANDILPRLVRDISCNFYGKDPNSNRMLLFLDPYGLQIKFDTLKQISNYKIDVILLFPMSGVYRNIPNDPNALERGKADKISDLLGVDNWEEDIYEKREDGLFDATYRTRMDVDQIEKYVTLRFKTIFEGWVTPQPLRLHYKANNAHAFSLYLLVGNTNAKAVNLAARIWKNATDEYNKQYLRNHTP